MDLIEIKNQNFPDDFESFLKPDILASLLVQMQNSTMIRNIYQIRAMFISDKKDNVSFNYHLTTLGGADDGLQVMHSNLIKSPDHLKTFLIQMALLGFKPWEWGADKELNFVEGWHKAENEIDGSKVVGFQHEECLTLFNYDAVIHQAFCAECNTPSQLSWDELSFETWINRNDWLGFPDGEHCKYFCPKCVKKISKL